jgi:cation transport regulator
MPYSSIHDLPDSVRDNLPEHAQEIFRKAFNSAHEEQRLDDARALKIAWMAVESKYEKKDAQWVLKTSSHSMP